jgi:hypothetical protein
MTAFAPPWSGSVYLEDLPFDHTDNGELAQAGIRAAYEAGAPIFLHVQSAPLFNDIVLHLLRGDGQNAMVRWTLMNPTLSKPTIEQIRTAIRIPPRPILEFDFSGTAKWTSAPTTLTPTRP